MPGAKGGRVSLVRNILPLLALCLVARAAPAADLLVIYSNSRLLPANVVADQSLREALASAPDPVELYSEFLDAPRFGGPDYDRTISQYLREKYRAHPPRIVLAAGDEAFAFLLRKRAEIFPGIPLVHLGVSVEVTSPLAPLPPDVVGVPVVYDGIGSVEQALRWQPETRRIVVVTGASAWDREWEAILRRGLAHLAPTRTLEFWAGLTIEELERRLGELSAGTLVFSPGFFEDGAGRTFGPPKSAASRIASASSAPVYAPYDTFIGTGVVGGRMPSYEAMGREAGEITKKLLAGDAPSSLDLPEVAPMRAVLDWRAARRFGIATKNIGADTLVLFKEPTFWEAYRGVVLAGAAVILLQGALIVALLLEQRRRRMSERRIELATSAAGLALWVWDARDAHDPFADVHPADRVGLERAVRQALDKNEPMNVEYRTIGEAGSVRWFAAYGRRESGAVTRLLGVARDVTDRKLAELQAERDRSALRHVGRVSMLGQLSASIAHQLNQPLAAILGNAEAARTLLGREPVDLAELREICDDIVSEDHRAAEVIRRLRALFKHGELKLAPLDLNELVSETLELARTDLLMRHVIAVADLAPALPVVRGDRVQLQQVVLNLIVNAADAMSATEEHRRELAIHTGRAGDAVEVSVGDRGPGIAPSDLERIFEPFWTTKPSGMGIGLTICRSILDAHRGRLTAANRADGGARFSVVVPAGLA